jgi:DNA adenine methylase
LTNTHEQTTLYPESSIDEKVRVDSPFRYPGGKFYALRLIMPFVNSVVHDEYREPFVGGGAVFFAKKKVKYNWLNDLDTDLMTTYSVIANSEERNALCSMLKDEIASKARHKEVKSMSVSSPLEIAFRTYYLNRTSFSGIIHKAAWGYKIGQSIVPKDWPRRIEPAGRKLEGVKLTAFDFEEVLKPPPIGNRLFAYLDPPYYGSDQKRAYAKSFVLADHLRLLKLLKKAKFDFCLSYDDHPKVREMYKWAYLHTRQWFYNTANIKNGVRKKGRELIITNYKVDWVSENEELSAD